MRSYRLSRPSRHLSRRYVANAMTNPPQFEALRNRGQAGAVRSEPVPVRSESDLIQEDLHEIIGKFVWQRIKRRPMVLPVVIQV